MQENEFEKKMQQEMDAFQLQPTEAVWQNVQAQVGKGKERKRKYLIFSFLLIPFLASTLLLADLKQHTASLNKQAENKIEKKLAQVNNEENLQLQQSNKKQESATTALTNNNNAGSKQQQQTTVVVNGNKIASHKIRRTTKGTATIKIEEAIISEEPATVNKNVLTEKYQSVKTELAVTNEEQQNKEIIEPKETVAEQQLKNEPTKENAAIAKAIQPSPQKTKKQFWNKSFYTAFGRSSTGSKYLNATAAADYNNSGSGTVPGNAGAGTYSPSATKPGFSFAAGFEISRSLSAKTTLGAGLQYQLFTTSIATGEKANIQSSSSGSREVFKSGSSNRYTSFYHFIILPVSFSTQVAAIKGRQINFTAGVNFLRLVHSNALLFDYTQGNYYRDNTIFNKTLVGLSAGASINLAGKNKSPFYIGPEFYYSLTPQAASGMYGQAHYKFFGIRLQKMLQKK